MKPCVGCSRLAWWCLFAVTMAVYLSMLGLTLPRLQTLAGGLAVPDVMAGGYSRAYLAQWMSRLGEAGRHFYLWRQLPLDMLYPALFSATYSTLLAFLLRQTGRAAGCWKALLALPLAAGVLDYLENALLIALLRQYAGPSADLPAAQAAAASALTVGKSACGSLTLLATLVLLLLWAWQRYRAAP